PQPGAPETPRAKITVVTTGLPFTSLLWTREDELVAAGHDCTPVVFRGNEAGWSTAYSVDDPKSKAGAGDEETSALSMFKRLDIRGSADKDDSLLKTIHQNPITQIRPYEYAGDRVSSISSSGYVFSLGRHIGVTNWRVALMVVLSFSHSTHRIIIACRSSIKIGPRFGGLIRASKFYDTLIMQTQLSPDM